MSEAFICPITNKLLDTAFKDITPYIPWNKDAKDYVCEKVTLPSIWEFNTGTNVSTFIDEVREKVVNDDRVAALKEQNLGLTLMIEPSKVAFITLTQSIPRNSPRKTLSAMRKSLKKVAKMC